MSAHSAMIHEFDGSGPPCLDEDGDERVGVYYQFVDEHEAPVGGMIGPYRLREQAERAAKAAFKRRDF